MELFFGKSEGQIINLVGDEFRHLVQVKRAQKGQEILVTDGEGNLFHCRISDITRSHSVLQIDRVDFQKPLPFRLHIAVAPTKNIDRMEWFIEKATETGIDEVSFILCRHSERKDIKTERLHRIVISAMKQSAKVYYPKINPVRTFESFVTEKQPGIKLVCSNQAKSIKYFGERYTPNHSLTALIGPEGDFNPDELELAVKNGYEATSLGNSRLRTETAALHVCTLFNFMNGN